MLPFKKNSVKFYRINVQYHMYNIKNTIKIFELQFLNLVCPHTLPFLENLIQNFFLNMENSSFRRCGFWSNIVAEAYGFCGGWGRVRLGREEEPKESAGEKSQVEDSPFASLQYCGILSWVLNKKKWQLLETY